jgi:hypothetical protein
MYLAEQLGAHALTDVLAPLLERGAGFMRSIGVPVRYLERAVIVDTCTQCDKPLRLVYVRKNRYFGACHCGRQSRIDMIW